MSYSAAHECWCKTLWVYWNQSGIQHPDKEHTYAEFGLSEHNADT